MGQEKLEDLFFKVKPGRNAFTDQIHGYVQIGKYVCEISSGGVGTYNGRCVAAATFIDIESMTPAPQFNDVFFGNSPADAIKKATAYLETLKL